MMKSSVFNFQASQTKIPSMHELPKDPEENGTIKKKRKTVSNYNYSFGDEYPVPKKKHFEYDAGPIVPDNMGWLWTANDITGKPPKKNWTPGAVGKTIARMMNFKCRGQPTEKMQMKKKKHRKRKTKQGLPRGDEESDEEPLESRPALKVHRKGDTFTIMVHPLKDLTVIAPNEDPYVDCDPLVFKIIKQRSPEERAKVEARRLVKLKKARDEEIRRALAEAVEDICKCAYMDVYCNNYSAIDKVIDKCPTFEEPKCICSSESLSSLSSNASWDIEYTPPFGCFDPSLKKRKHYVHVETQYNYEDAQGEQPLAPPPTTKTTDKQTSKKDTNRNVSTSVR